VHALLVFTAADENWVRDIQHCAVNPACFRDKAARVSCLCNQQKRDLCDMCVTFIWSRGRRLQAATLRATTTLHQRTAAGQISGAPCSVVQGSEKLLSRRRTDEDGVKHIRKLLYVLRAKRLSPSLLPHSFYYH